MNSLRRPPLPGQRPIPRGLSLGLSLGLLSVAVRTSAAEPGPLDIPRLQAQLTQGAPAAGQAADLLMVEAELRPTNPHLQYNAGVAAYAARRWEDALVAFDRVETLGHSRLADLARFQRGNAEYQLGVEARSANLDETISRWRAALEAYQSVLKVRPDDERSQANSAFVRDRLLELLLEEARKSAREAEQPTKTPGQRIPDLRNAHEKFSDARQLSPGNSEASQGESQSRDRLAEALKQEGLKNVQSPLGLKSSRREPRLPQVDASKLEAGVAQLEESRELRPGDPEVEEALKKAKDRLADAKVKQAETFLALEEQIPITKEKLALLRMAREQIDQALEQSPKHQEAQSTGEEIDRRMAQIHEDEGDFQEQQASFSQLEQQAMQLSQALDHFQQAAELRPNQPRLQAKQDQAGQKLAQTLDKLADKLMQSPGGQEPMESKAARLEGAEQALNELQSLQPSDRTAQRAEQVGKELDGLRQMLADKGKGTGENQGEGDPRNGMQPMPGAPQWMAPPLDGPPRIQQPGAKGQAPKGAGRNPRDY
jgi:hypothetical protein